MKNSTFLLCLILLISCENDIAEVNRIFAERQTNVEIAKEIEMTYSDSAVVRVTLQAPLLVRHLEGNEPFQEYPDGLFVEFYNDFGQKQGQVNAKYGLRYESKNQVILQDSVVWLSIRNEKLESDELIWDDKEHIVYSDKWVKITQPGQEVIYSYGFEADEDFTHWKLKTMEGSLPYEGFKKEENR